MTNEKIRAERQGEDRGRKWKSVPEFFFNLQEAGKCGPYYGEGDDGKQKNSSKNLDDRIGFINIPNYLIRINKVINGDEIKSRIKFIPEHPLRKGHKVYSVKNEKDEEKSHIFKNSAVEDTIGKNKQDEGKEQAAIDAKDPIIEGTDKKYLTESKKGACSGSIHPQGAYEKEKA